MQDTKLYKVHNQAPGALTSANDQTFCLMNADAHGWQPSLFAVSKPNMCMPML